jgi:soluble lytic murein transglycosylase
VLALVREESAFEAEAVSWVGAVGLTQLMPPTAEEVARRLGMRAPDLTDPLTNLRLGIWHLAGLRQYAGAFSRVMMAYNAGLGRLRSWEREFGPLPDELFAEAVPYSETRLYARQVLVAAVIYGVLYLDTPLGDTVTLFFPELSPLGYPAAP